MKKFLFVTLFLLLSVYCFLFAQNKTFGVGVSAPNANAALHVESPTANQGFILPRLTTAQRTAAGFMGILTATDNGLIVYDSDLKTIYIWDGTMWKTTAQVSGGVKLNYPYKDSIASATGTPDLFALKYNNPENKRILRLENLNTTNASSVLSAQQTGPGIGAFVQINNATNGGTAIYGTTNSNLGGAVAPVGVYGESTGTGSLGGSFRINNAGNTYPALFAETNGSGTTFHANQIGTGNSINAIINNASNTANALFATTNGTGGAARLEVNNVNSVTPALWAQTNSDQPLSTPVYGLNMGTGDPAGVFRVNNAASGMSALYGETNGSGAAIFGNQLGTGRGGTFQIQNASNAEAAVRGFTNGTGRAGFFTINNAANTSSGIFSTTNGTGAALQGENTGSGNGFAGLFNNTNAANTYPAIQAATAGLGSGVRVIQTTGSGAGMDVFMQNASSTAEGLAITQQGLGSAGKFVINNVSSAMPALWVESNSNQALSAPIYGLNTGTGDVASSFKITNAANNFPAVYAETSGTGRGGLFYITNGSNVSPAVQGRTVGNGTGVSGLNTGNGNAGTFDINNAASTSDALFAATDGIGNSLKINHTGSSGNLAVFQNNSSNVARISKTGQGFFNGGTTSSGADVAELFGVEGAPTDYEPGDVLIISDRTDRTVEKSNSPSSTRVAGVYATKPGVQLTERTLDENLDDLIPMGVIGVIPTKVCLENGPIKRGDLLVTSSKAGHAMKAIPVNVNGVLIYPTGAILGKALEDFVSEQSGLIKVLVNVK